MPQQLTGGFAEGLSGQSSGSLAKIWNYHENTALGVPVKDFSQRTVQEWEFAPLHGLQFQTAWKWQNASIPLSPHPDEDAGWAAASGSSGHAFPTVMAWIPPAVSPNKPSFCPATSPGDSIAAVWKVKKSWSKHIWLTFFKIAGSFSMKRGKGRREMSGRRRLVSSWSRTCEAKSEAASAKWVQSEGFQRRPGHICGQERSGDFCTAVLVKCAIFQKWKESQQRTDLQVRNQEFYFVQIKLAAFDRNTRMSLA